MKPIDYTMPRVNSNVSYGLWVMMCQWRFIDCNKYPTLVQDVDDEEAVHMKGEGLYGNAVLLLNFAVNINLL